MSSASYETDFDGWANEQATLLRHGRFADADNPSLKPKMYEAMSRAYEEAVAIAAGETKPGEAAFPSACPWSISELFDKGVWPEA